MDPKTSGPLASQTGQTFGRQIPFDESFLVRALLSSTAQPKLESTHFSPQPNHLIQTAPRENPQIDSNPIDNIALYV
jgi:hypothetical protein